MPPPSFRTMLLKDWRVQWRRKRELSKIVHPSPFHPAGSIGRMYLQVGNVTANINLKGKGGKKEGEMMERKGRVFATY